MTFLDKEEALGTSVSFDSTAQSDEDAKLVNEDEEAVEVEADNSKNIVKFVNASFSWQRGNNNVLHDLNLFIPSGCLTVIIGRNHLDKR